MTGGPDVRRHKIAPNAVRDHTGAWHHGDLVIVVPGQSCSPAWSAATSAILASRLGLLATARVMQTAPDGLLWPTTAVADGDSLRYYPAYDLPGRKPAGTSGAGRCAGPARSC